MKFSSWKAGKLDSAIATSSSLVLTSAMLPHPQIHSKCYHHPPSSPLWPYHLISPLVSIFSSTNTSFLVLTFKPLYDLTQHCQTALFTHWNINCHFHSNVASLYYPNGQLFPPQILLCLFLCCPSWTRKKLPPQFCNATWGLQIPF